MTAPRIPRHLKFGLIALAIGFVITLGLFVDVVGRIQSMVQQKEPEGNPFTPPAAPLYEQTDPRMTVKIFFPGMQEDIILSAEDQTIFRSAELANRARQILQKLLEGPKTPGLYPSLPKDTKLQEVFIDDMGTGLRGFFEPDFGEPSGRNAERAGNRVFHRELSHIQSPGNPAGEDSRRRRRKGNACRPLPAASVGNGSFDHRRCTAKGARWIMRTDGRSIAPRKCVRSGSRRTSFMLQKGLCSSKSAEPA